MKPRFVRQKPFSSRGIEEVSATDKVETPKGVEHMTKLTNLKAESDLVEIQRKLFETAKQNSKENKKLKFKGLMEIISSEITIMTAIHNIKSF